MTPEIKQLASDMISVTLDWEDSRSHELGVALAAIQVDQPLRIMVIRNNFEDKDDRSFKIFINPEITKLEGDPVEDLEGCLSVPDIYGKVIRYSKIRFRALGLNGRVIRGNAEGFLARVIQHEVDHMNGIVFVDHIKDKTEAFFKLNSNGELDSLDYDKSIRNSSVLW